MREGGDRRVQGSPAKPGLTLALPHTQRLPARDGHGVQTPPVSHRGVTMEIQNLNLQGGGKKKRRTVQHSPAPQSWRPFPHTLLSLTRPRAAPHRARAAKTKGTRENSTSLAALREIPPPPSRGRRRGGTCTGGLAAGGRPGGELPLPTCGAGRAARPSAAPAPPRRHVAPPPRRAARRRKRPERRQRRRREGTRHRLSPPTGGGAAAAAGGRGCPCPPALRVAVPSPQEPRRPVGAASERRCRHPDPGWG